MRKPPYIIQVPWLYGGFNGFAFWPFIVVLDKSDKRLIAHEMAHIEQQLKGWLFGFYIKYIYYHFRYGYKDNPYEIEARELGRKNTK